MVTRQELEFRIQLAKVQVLKHHFLKEQIVQQDHLQLQVHRLKLLMLLQVVLELVRELL